MSTITLLIRYAVLLSIAGLVGCATTPSSRSLFGPEECADCGISAGGSPASAVAQPESFPITRVDAGPWRAPADEPSIVASPDGQTVVVAWNDGRVVENGTTLWRLFAAISTDAGASWREVPLLPPAGVRAQHHFDPMTAIDPISGDLFVGGVAAHGSPGLDQVYLYRLASGESTLSGPETTATGARLDKGWMAAGGPCGAEDRSHYIAVDKRFQRFVAGQWGELNRLPGRSLTAALPRVAADGTVYVAYWNYGQSGELLRSDDCGESFQGPFTIAQRRGTGSVADEVAGSGIPGNFRTPHFQYLAVAPDGRLHAVWADTIATSPPHVFRVWHAVSADRGESWSQPGLISAVTNGDQFFPWIEAGSDGSLHVAWLDSRMIAQADEAGTAWLDVFYAWSLDGGASWSEQRVTPASFPSDGSNTWLGHQPTVGDYIGLTLTEPYVYVAFPYAQVSRELDVHVARIDRPRGPDWSGLWWHPQQAGHGFSLQLLETSRGRELLAYWFGYDAGQARWIVGQGPIVGESATMTALTTTGGRFPSSFDSGSLELVEWGDLEFQLESPAKIRVDWTDKLGDQGQGTLDLARLTAISDAPQGCWSGAWFDPGAPGHGLLIEVLDRNSPRLVVTWFAHHQGRQLWLQGSAPLENRRAALAMTAFTGGADLSGYDADAVRSEPWGELDLRFADQNRLEIRWRPLDPELPPGEGELVRLTQLAGHSCS